LCLLMRRLRSGSCQLSPCSEGGGRSTPSASPFLPFLRRRLRGEQRVRIVEGVGGDEVGELGGEGCGGGRGEWRGRGGASSRDESPSSGGWVRAAPALVGEGVVSVAPSAASGELERSFAWSGRTRNSRRPRAALMSGPHSISYALSRRVTCSGLAKWRSSMTAKWSVSVTCRGRRVALHSSSRCSAM
jgi:hypothetical protein